MAWRPREGCPSAGHTAAAAARTGQRGQQRPGCVPGPCPLYLPPGPAPSPASRGDADTPGPASRRRGLGPWSRVGGRRRANASVWLEQGGPGRPRGASGLIWGQRGSSWSCRGVSGVKSVVGHFLSWPQTLARELTLPGSHWRAHRLQLQAPHFPLCPQTPLKMGRQQVLGRQPPCPGPHTLMERGGRLLSHIPGLEVSPPAWVGDGIHSFDKLKPL